MGLLSGLDGLIVAVDFAVTPCIAHFEILAGFVLLIPFLSGIIRRFKIYSSPLSYSAATR